MGIRLRELHIRTRTSEGMFGTRVPFRNSLCILRAPNTSGKSTCLQAIVYALGLEGMFKSGNDVPLPQAVTEALKYQDRLIPVLESEVALELENTKGEVLTVQRAVRSNKNRNLISTWRSPLLTDPVGQSTVKQDYYVKLPGAAVRGAGFHHMLADFIGWTLPEVTRYAGGEVPLYLECICPLFIVEQKKGWAVLPARIPQYFGIRDVSKRAIEFLLDLDAYRNALKRQAAKERASGIRERWRERIHELSRLAASVNGMIDNVPNEPVATWPPTAPPTLSIARDGWIPIDVAARADWDRLTQLESVDIPKVSEIVIKLQSELRVAEEELSRLEYAARRSFQEMETESAQMQQANLRIASLRDDLRRYQDIRTLLKLGSDTLGEIAHGSCPACHQSLSDTLLPQDGGQAPMSAEENIEFIKSQLVLFSSMVAESERVVAAKQVEVESFRQVIDECRTRIRAIKETLVADGRQPSRASVEERIRLGQQVRMLEKARDTFSEISLRFGDLSSDWASALLEIRELPVGDLSDSDEEKLNLLESLMQEQLQRYGLSSIAPRAITISRDSYKPIHEGFDLEVNIGSVDLEFNNSASDMIRTHWAYMLALLEVARTKTTHHPGILILDEPRQQSTDRNSFNELLRRASAAGVNQQQIIIATSEERSILEPMLKSLPHFYIDFSEKLLTPQQQ